MRYHPLPLLLTWIIVTACAPANPGPPSASEPIGTSTPTDDYASELVLLDESGEAVWTTEIGWTSDRPILVHEGLAIVTTGGPQQGRIDATGVDIPTGDVVWQTKLPITSFIQQTVIRRGTVFVLHFDGLMALEAASGEVLWTVDFGESTGEIGFDTDRAYVSLHSGRTLAFDLITGATLWKHEVDRQGGGFGPLLTSDVVIVGRQSGPMYGLDAISGGELWRERRAPDGRFRVPLGLSRELLIAVEPAKFKGDDLMRGLEVDGTPSTEWTMQVPDWTKVWMDGDHLVSQRQRSLRGHEPSTGRVTWALTPQDIALDRLKPFITSLSALEGTSLVGVSRTESQRSSVWMIKDGHIAWTLISRRDVLGPWLQSPHIYVWQVGATSSCNCRGTLTTLDSATGEAVARVPTRRPVQTSPIATDEGVLVALSDFEVFQD